MTITKNPRAKSLLSATAIFATAALLLTGCATGTSVAKNAGGEDLLQGGSVICPDPSTWMGCMFPQGDKALTEITMPGSHDAATNEIMVDQMYAQGCGSVPIFVPKGISGKWAKTQTGKVGAQAANGSRYFDLRPYFNAQGTLSTCHTLEGDTFMGAIGTGSDFKKFLTAHPNEIFILDLQDFFSEYGDVLTEAHQTQLKTWLTTELGSYIFPRDKAETTLSQVNISTMRKAEKNVVVLAKDSWATDLMYWPRSVNLHAEWNDVSKPAITFWDAPIFGSHEQWPIDLAERELGVLNRAPATGKLNVLNYILDTACPENNVGSGPCYSAYTGWAGTVDNTRQWLFPRIPSFIRQIARVSKPAIVMRDVASEADNSIIWNLNTQEKK